MSVIFTYQILSFRFGLSTSKKYGFSREILLKKYVSQHFCHLFWINSFCLECHLTFGLSTSKLWIITRNLFHTKRLPKFGGIYLFACVIVFLFDSSSFCLYIYVLFVAMSLCRVVFVSLFYRLFPLIFLYLDICGRKL